MAERLFGYTLFCDDIRNEVGGKVSLVGVYGAHLLVENQFPVRLPKLGFYVVIVVPRERDIKTMTLRIYVPGNESDDAPDIEGEVQIRPSSKEQTRPYMRFAHALLFSDVVLERPGNIRVRAMCDGELLKLGVLSVQTPDAAQVANSSSE